MTFARTGDTDIDDLPDPAGLDARTTSPAQGLRGHYHQTRTFANASVQEYDMSVSTDCLRNGQRCLSLFIEPQVAGYTLAFADGKWTLVYETDADCVSGGTTHLKLTGEYPLPRPPTDPIVELTGRGHQLETGSSCVGGDFDDRFVRTGN